MERRDKVGPVLYSSLEPHLKSTSIKGVPKSHSSIFKRVCERKQSHLVESPLSVCVNNYTTMYFFITTERTFMLCP